MTRRPSFAERLGPRAQRRTHATPATPAAAPLAGHARAQNSRGCNVRRKPGWLWRDLDPSAPILTGDANECTDNGNTVSSPGEDHQALARLTGGLRYSSCRTDNYDPIFTAIAQAVVEGAQLPCEYDVPPPPNGELIDVERLTVTWTHDGGSEAIARVDSCTGAGYRLDYSRPPTRGSRPSRSASCSAPTRALRCRRSRARASRWISAASGSERKGCPGRPRRGSAAHQRAQLRTERYSALSPPPRLEAK